MTRKSTHLGSIGAAVLATLGLLAAALPAAHASPPVRIPLAPQTLDFRDVCTGFVLHYAEGRDTEKLTIFGDSKAILTGDYWTTLSNPNNGKSITLHAPGPQFLNFGATVVESGPQVFVLFPGDVWGPGVYLLTGRITATHLTDSPFTTTNITYTGTRSSNLCDALA